MFHLTQGLNIPLPYPWPWQIDLYGAYGFDLLARAGTAAAFALPLVLYPVGLVIAWPTQPESQAERSVLISAAIVGTSTFITIRSDVLHLAQAIHALIILALAVPVSMSAGRMPRTLVLGTLGPVTLVVALKANQSLRHFRPGEPVECVVHEIAGERLKLPAAQAEQLRGIEAAIRSRVGPCESFFVARTGPGFYPALGKKNPAWWLYFLWPATDIAQRRIIERLDAAAVQWALIIDDAIDGREALRFRNSNPQVWEYLNRFFDLPRTILEVVEIACPSPNPTRRVEACANCRLAFEESGRLCR